MRTHAFLCDPLPDENQLRMQIESMEDRELLQAVHNPDHSSVAISIVCEVLRKHDRTEEEIHRFRTDPDEHCMPSFGPTPTPNAARARAYRWRKVNRFLNVCILAALGAWLVVFSGQHDDPSGPALVTRTVESLVGIGFWVLAAALYLAKPLFWRSPARLLLLRPFGATSVSLALKLFVRTNLTYFGHIFTLADKDLKESLFLLRLLSVTPISIESLFLLPYYPFIKRLRPRIFVKNASDYCALRDRLWSRWILNTFWRGSYLDKIRAIHTSDAWWRRCIDLLASTCEAIVVDLTIVKAGTRWELSKIFVEGLLPKTIFVVHNTCLPQAQEILADYSKNTAAIPVFVYNSVGRLDRDIDFEEALCRCLSQSRPQFTGRARLSRLAIWAVILSLASWFLLVLVVLLSGVPLLNGLSLFIFYHAAFLSPLLAFSALNKMRYAAGRLRGRVLAICGAALSGLPFVVALFIYTTQTLVTYWTLAHRSDVAQMFSNRGDHQSDQNHLNEAQKSYEEALAIYRRLAAKDQDTYLPEIAPLLNKLGLLYWKQHQLAEAQKSYQEAVNMFRKLVDKNRETYLPDLARTLNNFGVLQSDQHQPREAEEFCQEAVETFRKLSDKNQAYLPDLALMLTNLGSAQSDQDQPAEAQKSYQEALQIYQACAKQNAQQFSADVARLKEMLLELPR
jgi:tetratricopeptide (TPR) repeat protein